MRPRNDKILSLRVPQIPNENRVFDLDNLPTKQSWIPGDASSDGTPPPPPDFALAALHDAIDDGWEFSHGADCVSTTTIVLQSGCSSSTAFTVAWIQVLAMLAQRLEDIDTPLKLAQRAHRAEVLHFGAPGGTMDHVTIASGGNPLRIGPGMWDVQVLNPLDPTKDGVWVLADSGEPKDTMKHLRRCKGKRLELLDKLKGTWDINQQEKDLLDEEERVLLDATIVTRDREEDAARLWVGRQDNLSAEAKGPRLGRWMLEHHEALRDGLDLSTPKIERLREAAMNSGAWGFKLVGSGGGGCCVAWAPLDKVHDVSKGMVEAGANAIWIIETQAQAASIEIIS